MGEKAVGKVRERKTNSIGHKLHRNCLLNVIEGKIYGRIELARDAKEDISSYWIM